MLQLPLPELTLGNRTDVAEEFPLAWDKTIVLLNGELVKDQTKNRAYSIVEVNKDTLRGLPREPTNRTPLGNHVPRRLIVDPSVGTTIHTLVYVPNEFYSVTLLDAIPVALDVFEVH